MHTLKQWRSEGAEGGSPRAAIRKGWQKWKWKNTGVITAEFEVKKQKCG